MLRLSHEDQSISVTLVQFSIKDGSLWAQLSVYTQADRW